MTALHRLPCLICSSLWLSLAKPKNYSDSLFCGWRHKCWILAHKRTLFILGKAFGLDLGRRLCVQVRRNYGVRTSELT